MALWPSVAVTLLAACGQASVFDRRYELNLRVVRHAWANPGAANITVANEVWQLGAIEFYDALNLDSALQLPEDSCGLEVKLVASDVTDQALVPDSTLVLLYRTILGADTLYHPTGEAIGYFTPFMPPNYAWDTVPVFILPYLGVEVGPGQVDRISVIGYADPNPSGVLAPSVWLNSYYILLFNEASTLAHELGHLLVDLPPFAIFDDNATPFLNIMTLPIGVMKYRRRAGFALALEQLPADEMNVRQLVSVANAAPAVQNQCELAKFYGANVSEIWEIPE